MFPHGLLTLQATWRLCGRQIKSERRRSNRRASIAWTRIHAIARSSTCLKIDSKWHHRRAYLAPRGQLWSAWSSSNGGRCDHDHHRDQLDLTADTHRNRWPRDRAIVATRSPERNRTALDDRGRTPRSRRDRAAIAARSSRDWGEDGAGLERNRLPSIGKRSTKLEQHDRARSRLNRGAIVAKIVARSWLK